MMILPKLVNPQWDSLPAGSRQQVFALQKNWVFEYLAVEKQNTRR